jgi:hypothetical protein
MPISHKSIELSVFLVILSFGFRNIVRVGMDRACQGTFPQKVSAQTDERFPSYSISKFRRKWVNVEN